MYACCPSCNATFRITAAILQMSAGEVRCGMCGNAFNALDTLRDEWTGEVLPPTGSGGQTPPPQPEGASPADASATVAIEPDFEFSAPENEWPELFLSPQDAPRPLSSPSGAAGAEPAPLPEGISTSGWTTAGPDWPPEPGEAVGSLEEETADTDTWQGFLREAGLAAEAAHDASDEAPGDDSEAGEEHPADAVPYVLGEMPGHDEAMVPEIAVLPDEEAGEDTLDQPGLVMAAILPEMPEEDAEANAGEGIEADIEALVGEAAAERANDIPPPTAQDEPPPAAPAAAATPAAEPAPHSVLDWDTPPAFARRTPPSRAHAGRWFIASLVAALLLAGQLLHHYRDDLAAGPFWGESVRNLYDRLGMPLYPNWPLDAYEIGSRKAQVENPAQAALDIAAEIAVTGNQPVGLPLLRVTLLDRWSNIAGSGVFGPEDYLAERLPAASTYAPGTLVPVRLRLQDPGDKVTGYDLDICLPSRHAGLRCQKARNPFRR
ncbi:MAG: DUF3426 domain-containing protein [Gammaproteobacteria bacterium]|nr:DUF3426 domain-containing protein [Gammaproteobacteria bacterium]